MDSRKISSPKLIIFLFLLIVPGIIEAQDFEEHEIDQFYKKVELEDGILNEEGEEIDFILTKEAMEDGKYEVEITDGPGDLYQVKDTKYFVKFEGYYGYAGYGDKGILVVESYSGSFYEKQ